MNVKEIDCIECRERLIITEQSLSNIQQQMSNTQEQTIAIVKLSTSIEYMARQVEEMLAELKEHDGRLNDLENAPGKSLVSYWKILIGAVISSSVGLLFGLILRGGI